MSKRLVNGKAVEGGERQTLTADDLRAMLREACKAEGGQSAWATAHGISPQFVSDVLSGYRGPGNILAPALGLVENGRTWRVDNDRTGA